MVHSAYLLQHARLIDSILDKLVQQRNKISNINHTVKCMNNHGLTSKSEKRFKVTIGNYDEKNAFSTHNQIPTNIFSKISNWIQIPSIFKLGK